MAAATVMVIGGGAVGMNAAFIAIGMEADVFVYDVSIDKLRELDVAFGGRASTVYSSTLAIEEMLPRADLVIGAVLVHGAKAPYVVRREQLKLMKRNAVLVDVAIDQGGCFETSHPTTHRDPTFEVDGITHYCVANMPGAVPITSTYALTNATLPYVLALADHGVAEAARRDPGLRLGINVAAGTVTHPAVAEAVGVEHTPVEDVLGQQTESLTKEEKWQPQPRRSRRRRRPRSSSFKNMIGGEFVDPAEGKTEDVVNPATGEVIAHSPLSTEEDVDRAVKAARGAFETWQYTTPSERQELLLKLADAFQERAEEITDWETRDAGKPRQVTFDEEIPPMVDQLRFFAGAARTMEGPRRGRVHGGPHLLHPSRAGRRGGADHALELPADDGRLEDRPRARHRMHPRS